MNKFEVSTYLSEPELFDEESLLLSEPEPEFSESDRSPP